MEEKDSKFNRVSCTFIEKTKCLEMNLLQAENLNKKLKGSY